MKSQFESLQQSEQRPPANNGHKFGVTRVVVVHKFDCYRIKITQSKYVTPMTRLMCISINLINFVSSLSENACQCLIEHSSLTCNSGIVVRDWPIFCFYLLRQVIITNLQKSRTLKSSLIFNADWSWQEWDEWIIVFYFATFLSSNPPVWEEDTIVVRYTVITRYTSFDFFT